MKAFFISVLAIFFLVILFFAIKSRSFLKILFLNALIGIAALTVIDFTRGYTGIFIPVNWYTVSGCGIFGLPAVCFFLILQIIFI